MGDFQPRLIGGGPGNDWALWEISAVDMSQARDIPIPCAGYDLATVSYEAAGTWTAAVVTVRVSNSGGKTIDSYSPSVTVGGAATTSGQTPIIFLCAQTLYLSVTTAESGAKANFYVYLKKGQYSTATNHNLLSATHSDTVAGAAVLGGMVYANSTPAWAQLAGSTSSQRAILTQTGTGTVSAAPAWLLDDPLMKGTDLRERTLYPALGMMSTGSIANVNPTSGTAYFVYLGRTAKSFTPQHVYIYQSAPGTGAQTAECGLFSTVGPPKMGTLSLTKLVSTGTMDDLTAGSAVMKGNTSAFATAIAAGTYLWAGVRLALASSQPTCGAIRNDFLTGGVLVTAGASALTGAGPWSGVLTTNPNDALLASLATLD